MGQVDTEAPLEVIAYRDGGWWTFEIPRLTAPSPRPGGTPIVAMGQARSAEAIAATAADTAALWLNTDEKIAVDVVYRLPGVEIQIIDEAREKEQSGRAALDEAATLRRRIARELLDAGLTATDAATILGVTRQRVAQLSR